MLKGFIRQVLEMATALGAANIAGDWAVHYAFEYRGYQAVGGEYLFIAAVFMLVYNIASYVLDVLEERLLEGSADAGTL